MNNVTAFIKMKPSPRHLFLQIVYNLKNAYFGFKGPVPLTLQNGSGQEGKLKISKI